MSNSIDRSVNELIKSVDAYSCLDNMKETFSINAVEEAKNEYFKIKKSQLTLWNKTMKSEWYAHKDLYEIDGSKNYYVKYRGVVCLEKSTKSWHNVKRKYCFECWNKCEKKFKEQCDGVNVNIWDEKKKKIEKHMDGSEIIKSPIDHLCCRCFEMIVKIRHLSSYEDCPCYFCMIED